MTVIENPIKTREDSDLVELETLWEAPAARPKAAPRVPNLDRFRRPLVLAWGAVIISLLLEPAPQQDVATPWYAWVLLAAFGVALIGMFTVLATGSTRLTFGASLLAGALGLAIGLGCLQTGHHSVGWAVYEIGVFAGLALASGAGLLAARQR